MSPWEAGFQNRLRALTLAIRWRNGLKEQKGDREHESTKQNRTKSNGTRKNPQQKDVSSFYCSNGSSHRAQIVRKLIVSFFVYIYKSSFSVRAIGNRSSGWDSSPPRLLPQLLGNCCASTDYILLPHHFPLCPF